MDENGKDLIILHDINGSESLFLKDQMLMGMFKVKKAKSGDIYVANSTCEVVMGPQMGLEEIGCTYLVLVDSNDSL